MLPFTAEVFFSFIGRYNAAIWPLPVLGWLICLAAAGLTLRANGATGRVIAGLLAVAWAWTGIVFHQFHFSEIFFAAPLFAAAFILQAALFAWIGFFRTTSLHLQSDPVGGAGLGLVVFALLGWPVVDWLNTGEWQSVRLAGTTPAPTVLFTLGVLLLAEGRPPLYLAVIPLLWALLGGVGAWVLQAPETTSLPLAGIGAFGLMIWKSRRTSATFPRE